MEYQNLQENCYIAKDEYDFRTDDKESKTISWHCKHTPSQEHLAQT